MKKNGFIATSIMYSFFAVFTIVALITLASYSHYRVLIDNLNNSVLSELNTNISSKYTTIYNLINNGDFEEDSSWVYSNSERLHKDPNNGTSSFSGSYSTRMDYATSQLSQSFAIDKINADNTTHKIFIYYRVNRNGPILGTPSITMNVSGSNYSLDSSGLTGSFANWVINSQIINVNVANNSDWSLSFNIVNNTKTNYVFIDNVMVIDVTNVFKNSSMSDSDIKNYLNTYLEYFNGSYVIDKQNWVDEPDWAANTKIIAGSTGNEYAKITCLG